MKKAVLLLLLSMRALVAEQVEIISDTMFANQLQKEVFFEGNVKISKEKSHILSNKVNVYFDEGNQTKMYSAVGNVSFELFSTKGHYSGRSEELDYLPLKDTYLFRGKVEIFDLINHRKIFGEKVTIDMQSGTAEILGKPKQPVRFLFDVNQSEEKQ